MLINQENIRSRFSENLVWATGIDLATAWATSNTGLRELQDRTASLEVRAVVGLWGNLTDPFALRILADMGELRLADENRRFHPKVYVFRGEGRSVAWIGSANFTSGGFGMNEEALFETSDTQAVESWFDRLWEQCGPLDENAIKNYAESRKENPPRPPLRPPVTIDSTPMQLLKVVDDWRSYVEALEQCDRWWWSKSNASWSVLEETCSWSATILGLHDVVRQENWRTLGDYDKKRLLGLTGEGGWALLGAMRRSALNTVFGANRKKIQNAVRRVVTAKDEGFLDVAIAAYEELVHLEGVGPGIATRLLTLARPDRFVSLNNASNAGLADFFGLVRSTLGTPNNYGRLLEAIYDQTWFREPARVNSREETICWMRVALLDCFIYDPKLPSQ